MVERLLMVTRILSFRVVACWVIGLLSIALTARAEVKQGTAVVKGVTGAAAYVDALGFTHPLKVGDVVRPGETVKTDAGSTVDLFLDQNGPGIGLNPNSTLRLDKLTYEQSAMGTVIDTRLDLRAGELYGIVKKLAAGSHFEVKMPQGVAVVRGTEFFINAQDGTVYVTRGTVLVHLVLNLASGGTMTKDLYVNAGQSGQYLSIPTDGARKVWDNLAAAPFPKGTTRDSLLRLAKLNKLLGPLSGNEVTETFNARTAGSSIHIDKPPVSIVVSP